MKKNDSFQQVQNDIKRLKEQQLRDMMNKKKGEKTQVSEKQIPKLAKQLENDNLECIVCKFIAKSVDMFNAHLSIKQHVMAIEQLRKLKEEKAAKAKETKASEEGPLLKKRKHRDQTLTVEERVEEVPLEPLKVEQSKTIEEPVLVKVNPTEEKPSMEEEKMQEEEKNPRPDDLTRLLTRLEVQAKAEEEPKQEEPSSRISSEALTAIFQRDEKQLIDSTQRFIKDMRQKLIDKKLPAGGQPENNEGQQSSKKTQNSGVSIEEEKPKSGSWRRRNIL